MSKKQNAKSPPFRKGGTYMYRAVISNGNKTMDISGVPIITATSYGEAMRKLARIAPEAFKLSHEQ